MSEYSEVLNRRIAVQSFQPDSNISSQDLYSLIEDASLAPSSFNLQHCRFMAITTPELKSELANVTLPANRQKVMDASLCLLFVGDTLAHIRLLREPSNLVFSGSSLVWRHCLSVSSHRGRRYLERSL